MSSSTLSTLPVLFALTLLINTVGFRRMVYFLSVGYAFSVTAAAIALVIIFRDNLSVLTVLQSTALTFWGLRLGVFVVRREFRPGFQKERERVDKEYGSIRLPAKFVIWISVSALHRLIRQDKRIGPRPTSIMLPSP